MRSVRTRNPYLREFRRLEARQGRRSGRLTAEAVRAHRTTLVQRYAWAVPSDEALDLLTRQAPLVEIGAGTGYWGWLLRQRGVEIALYDLAPPGGGDANPYHPSARCWTEVLPGGPEVLDSYPGRTLFLCWPPLNSGMAAACLRGFRGQRLVYVGEERGGCNAEDAFFDELEAGWQCVERLALPCWPGTRDALRAWERRTPA